MKMSFRWYGESDPISLEYISQIPGMHSIVSAVYDVKPGEVWPEESIKHLVDECAAHGLIFDVVESIPVTEEIKLGRPERDRQQCGRAAGRVLRKHPPLRQVRRKVRHV